MTPTEPAEQYYDLSKIRTGSRKLFNFVSQGHSKHFQVDQSRLLPTASYIADVIKENYPDLLIPIHSRIRHFPPAYLDLYNADLEAENIEKLRRQFELIITSVLLDGGAGPRWQYYDKKTKTYLSRSEGLAVASFNCYWNGIYSPRSDNPFYVDGDVINSLTEQELYSQFQISDGNALVGFSSRIKLLKDLGIAIKSSQSFFHNGSFRLGHLADEILSLASDNIISMSVLFEILTTNLAKLWVREDLPKGVAGDIWHHTALESSTNPLGLIPFHKILQWLTYSLLEPLENFGITVVDKTKLTGLPEYRNGGLLVDMDVLRVITMPPIQETLDISSELVVEWRALTISILDKLKPIVETCLAIDQPIDLSMGQFLQGGSWSAGRKLARELRADGGPPFKVKLDGIVF